MSLGLAEDGGNEGHESATFICETCLSMFSSSSPKKGFDKTLSGPHHLSRKSLQRSVNAGCLICTLVSRQCIDFAESFFEFWTSATFTWEVENNFVLCITYNSRKSPYNGFINFRVQDARRVPANLVRASLSETNTGHKNIARLARHWLKTCSEEHPGCPKFKVPVRYPSRLLQLMGAKVRLITCSEERLQHPYATMSHCWGESPFFRLTSKTEHLLQSGVLLTDFPQAFRDVIITALRLKIQYLWIDSYCILQPETVRDEVEEDAAARREWIAEASKMKDIYANGIINFGATYARDPSEGCFAGREINHTQDFTIYWRPNPTQPECLYHVYPYDLAKKEYSDFYSDHALMKRGWVLQERILAPRTLHFGKTQIYWECPRIPERLACETFPEGFPYVDHRDFVSLTRADGQGNPVPMHWGDVLQHYSNLALSHPTTDKLVALAGIAQEFAKLLDDDYIAGFFRKSLLQLLCWEPEKDASRSTEWRAPSWSWASMDGPLKVSDTNTGRPNGASIVDIRVETLDPNVKYGPLRAGSISLKGRLVYAIFQRTDLERKQSVYATGTNIEVIFDDVGEMMTAKDTLVLLLVLDAHSPQSNRQGLLLQQEQSLIYRRLGVFTIKWKQWQSLIGGRDEVITLI